MSAFRNLHWTLGYSFCCLTVVDHFQRHAYVKSPLLWVDTRIVTVTAVAVDVAKIRRGTRGMGGVDWVLLPKQAAVMEAWPFGSMEMGIYMVNGDRKGTRASGW